MQTSIPAIQPHHYGMFLAVGSVLAYIFICGILHITETALMLLRDFLRFLSRRIDARQQQISGDGN